MTRTLVLAEPGCTHQGDHDTILRLIDTAAECGADVFKNTWVSSAERLAERRHAPEYLYAYRWHQWPVAWHQDFRARCTERGLKYACTVDLPEDVAVLAPLVDYLKIAGFHANDEELLKACRAYQGKDHSRDLFVSHPGASTYEYRCWWAPTKHLHVVSAYPAPLAAANLACIREVHDQWGDTQQWGFDGYSDHTRHLLAGAVAVACGAEIVETHFRLYDCDEDNPDYAVAFEPHEFKTYIKNIRDAEILLGDGHKTEQDCEQPMLKYRVTA